MFGSNGASKGLLALAVLCVAWTIAPQEALAWRVSPMVYDLEPTGQNSSKTLRVENQDEKPLPVELYAESRVILPDGKETRAPADDDFLIFPPQAIIEPGKSQAFRVQYIGSPDIKASKTYVVTVSQLPVDVSKIKGSGVQFVFKFGTSANVVPPGAQPVLKVLSASVADVKGQGHRVLISVENTGTSYARLNQGTWTIRNASGKTVTLAGDQLRSMLDMSMIQPGTRRDISFPVPADFQGNGVTAIYDFKPSAAAPE